VKKSAIEIEKMKLKKVTRQLKFVVFMQKVQKIKVHGF